MSRRPAAGRMGSVAPRPIAARASAAMPLRLPRQSIRQGPGRPALAARSFASAAISACSSRSAPAPAAGTGPGRLSRSRAMRGSGISPSRLTTSGESGSAAKRTSRSPPSSRMPLPAIAAAGSWRCSKASSAPCRPRRSPAPPGRGPAAAAPPTRAASGSSPWRAQQVERLGLGEEADRRRMHRARRLPGRHQAAAEGGCLDRLGLRGVEEQRDPGPVDLEQREARCLGGLQRRQRARRQQRRVARAQQPQQVVALPLGGREHALGTAAIEEAGIAAGAGRGSRRGRPAARNPSPRSPPAWWWCRSAGRARRPPAAPGCRPRSNSAR